MSVGEILDRTIAIVRRRWLALFAILALAAVPVAALQLAAEPGLVHLMDALNRLFALAPSDVAGRSGALDAVARALAPSPVTVLYVAAQLLLFPLAQTAAFAYTGAELAGRGATMLAAYRGAFTRWPAQIAVLIAFVVLSWLLIVPLGVGVLGIALTSSLLAPLSRNLAGVAAMLSFGVLAAAGVLTIGAGYFAWLMASASIATEGCGPAAAIRSGVRRVLDPALRRRTLAIAPALLGVNWTATLALTSLGGAAANVTHLSWILTVLPALTGIVIDGVRVVFVQTYVDDLRQRREGRDLLAAAAGLPAPLAADEAGLTAPERALVETFIERRAGLDPAAAAEIAARIAGRVRPRQRASFDYLDDAALLEHLARSRG